MSFNTLGWSHAQSIRSRCLGSLPIATDVRGQHSSLTLIFIRDIILHQVGQGYKQNDDIGKSIGEQSIRRRTHKVQVQGASFLTNLLLATITQRLPCQSAALGGLTTQFNLFVPANASSTHKVPVLIYLSGLTCTEDTGCAVSSPSNP